jgi:hypothetical protein
MEEIWRDVKDFENYKVSNNGRFIFKAKEKTGNGGCVILLKERELKVSNNIHNYVSLFLISGIKTKKTSLHRIVFETFNHDIPLKMVVNHINGVKNDNRLENLECISQSENIKHAYKNGLIRKIKC